MSEISFEEWLADKISRMRFFEMFEICSLPGNISYFPDLGQIKANVDAYANAIQQLPDIWSPEEMIAMYTTEDNFGILGYMTENQLVKNNEDMKQVYIETDTPDPENKYLRDIVANLHEYTAIDLAIIPANKEFIDKQNSGLHDEIVAFVAEMRETLLSVSTDENFEFGVNAESQFLHEVENGPIFDEMFAAAQEKPDAIPIELLKFQERHCDNIVRSSSSLTNESHFTLDSSETGDGKTYTGVMSAIRSGATQVLVICPNAVIDTWRRVLGGTRIFENENGEPTYFITSYSTFPSTRGSNRYAGYMRENPGYPDKRTDLDWVMITGKGKNASWKWNIPHGTFVIWDEAHRAKGKAETMPDNKGSGKRDVRSAMLSTETAAARMFFSFTQYIHKEKKKWIRSVMLTATAIEHVETLPFIFVAFNFIQQKRLPTMLNFLDDLSKRNSKYYDPKFAELTDYGDKAVFFFRKHLIGRSMFSAIDEDPDKQIFSNPIRPLAMTIAPQNLSEYKRICSQFEREIDRLSSGVNTSGNFLATITNMVTQVERLKVAPLFASAQGILAEELPGGRQNSIIIVTSRIATVRELAYRLEAWMTVAETIKEGRQQNLEILRKEGILQNPKGLLALNKLPKTGLPKIDREAFIDDILELERSMDEDTPERREQLEEMDEASLHVEGMSVLDKLTTNASLVENQESLIDEIFDLGRIDRDSDEGDERYAELMDMDYVTLLAENFRYTRSVNINTYNHVSLIVGDLISKSGSKKKTDDDEEDDYDEMTPDEGEEAIIAEFKSRDAYESIVSKKSASKLTTGQKAEVVNNFQRNNRRILLATIRSGSEGISLHDTSKGGMHPRVMFVCGEISASKYIQTFGRTVRSGQTSNAIRFIPFLEAVIREDGTIAPGSDLEHALVTYVEAKINFIRKLHKGVNDIGLISEIRGRVVSDDVLQERVNRIATGFVASETSAVYDLTSNRRQAIERKKPVAQPARSTRRIKSVAESRAAFAPGKPIAQERVKQERASMGPPAKPAPHPMETEIQLEVNFTMASFKSPTPNEDVELLITNGYYAFFSDKYPAYGNVFISLIDKHSYDYPLVEDFPNTFIEHLTDVLASTGREIDVEIVREDLFPPQIPTSFASRDQITENVNPENQVKIILSYEAGAIIMHKSHNFQLLTDDFDNIRRTLGIEVEKHIGDRAIFRGSPAALALVPGLVYIMCRYHLNGAGKLFIQGLKRSTFGSHLPKILPTSVFRGPLKVMRNTVKALETFDEGCRLLVEFKSSPTTTEFFRIESGKESDAEVTFADNNLPLSVASLVRPISGLQCFWNKDSFEVLFNDFTYFPNMGSLWDKLKSMGIPRDILRESTPNTKFLNEAPYIVENLEGPSDSTAVVTNLWMLFNLIPELHDYGFKMTIASELLENPEITNYIIVQVDGPGFGRIRIANEFEETFMGLFADRIPGIQAETVGPFTYVYTNQERHAYSLLALAMHDMRQFR